LFPVDFTQFTFHQIPRPKSALSNEFAQEVISQSPPNMDSPTQAIPGTGFRKFAKPPSPDTVPQVPFSFLQRNVFRNGKQQASSRLPNQSAVQEPQPPHRPLPTGATPTLKSGAFVRPSVIRARSPKRQETMPSARGLFHNLQSAAVNTPARRQPLPQNAMPSRADTAIAASGCLVDHHDRDHPRQGEIAQIVSREQSTQATPPRSDHQHQQRHIPFSHVPVARQDGRESVGDLKILSRGVSPAVSSRGAATCPAGNSISPQESIGGDSRRSCHVPQLASSVGFNRQLQAQIGHPHPPLLSTRGRLSRPLRASCAPSSPAPSTPTSAATNISKKRHDSLAKRVSIPLRDMRKHLERQEHEEQERRAIMETTVEHLNKLQASYRTRAQQLSEENIHLHETVARLRQERNAVRSGLSKAHEDLSASRKEADQLVMEKDLLTREKDQLVAQDESRAREHEKLVSRLESKAAEQNREEQALKDRVTTLEEELVRCGDREKKLRENIDQRKALFKTKINEAIVEQQDLYNRTVSEIQELLGERVNLRKDIEAARALIDKGMEQNLKIRESFKRALVEEAQGNERKLAETNNLLDKEREKSSNLAEKLAREQESAKK
jgi:hypothetical protein